MDADFLPLLTKLRNKSLTSLEFKSLKQAVQGIVCKKTLSSGLTDEDREEIVSAIWLKFCQSPIWKENGGIKNLSSYFMYIVASCVSDFFRKDDASLYKKTQQILKESKAFTIGVESRSSAGTSSNLEPKSWEMARWFPVEWKESEILPVDDRMFLDYSMKSLSFEETIHIIDAERKIESRPESIRNDETQVYFRGVFDDLKRMFNINAGLLAAQLKELLAQKFWIEPHGKTSLFIEGETDGAQEERFSASDAVDDYSRQPSEFELSLDDLPDFFVERRLSMLIQSIESNKSLLTPTHLWILFVQLSEKRGIPYIELSKKLKTIPELDHFGKSRLYEMERLTVEIFKKHGIEPTAYTAGIVTTVLKRYFIRKFGHGEQ